MVLGMGIWKLELEILMTFNFLLVATPPPSTTLQLPENWNPTVYIIPSILVGVPVLVALYCIIGASIKAFCCKAKPLTEQQLKPKNTRFDYYGAEDEWRDNDIITINHTIDLPNDPHYVDPRTSSSNPYDYYITSF